MAGKIRDIKARAAAEGREVSFGIRLHVIVRDTNEKAWEAAEDLIRHVDEKTIAEARRSSSAWIRKASAG